MARMTAARAAVEILKREGVRNAFGVPGAAINPFYAALKAAGGIQHTLARHVEGASHMAEGYTRTHPGNIGVCVGTSGPAGTDMISRPGTSPSSSHDIRTTRAGTAYVVAPIRL
ncbi:thiamine pyrophosphate-binding protein, partial [Streptomyces griseoviridis]|uniref:thiamine pyrophosphate-binding protein n=1 Tax=Streptomyces griseoviridis TaxID=45398 RepID=UPI003442244A